MSDLLHERYRIVCPLGQGGAGQTYLGHDTAQDRPVVIKELYTAVQAGDPRVREAEVLRRLHHAQVPDLLDVFVEPVRGVPRLHLVMEHVDGRSLAEVVAARRPTVEDVVADVEGLLGILVDLQALSPPLLHRDIKPANVLKRVDGSLVLIDFGLATDGVAKTLGHTMVAGTLGYQSPEQIAGAPTPSSDVYSVGVLAWSMLANRPPTDRLVGQGLDGWARDVVHAPSWLRAWLEQALAPAGERFPDAASALVALRARASVSERPHHREVAAPSSTPDVRPEPPSSPTEPWWEDAGRWILAFALLPSVLAVVLFLQGWGPFEPRVGGEEGPAPSSQPTCADDDATACWQEANRQIDEEQPPNIGSALLLADRACELGSPDGCAWLGRTWGEGVWFNPNPDKALTYTAAACQLNATNTCDRLFALLNDRESTREQDIFRILQQWDLDCRNLEDPLDPLWTCQVLLMWHGKPKPWGGSDDLTRILPAAERLCEAGHAGSCLYLGSLVEESAPERALGLYERLCSEDPGEDFDAQRVQRGACQGAFRLSRG